MSFETIGLRFLVRNRAAFCPIGVLPQMQCGRDADETLSFRSSTIRVCNDLTLSLNINTDYTRIPTFRVLLVLCGAKNNVANLL